MQLDPATRSGQPFLHELGVMIARIVQEYVDADHQRIERFQRFQQPDRRYRVDRFGFDHAGLAGFEIDRAVDVDALAPARLFDRELLCLRGPATHGRAAWVGCTASTNIATSSSPLEFNRSS